MILRGSCHCGALRVEHETALPLDEIQLRECQCSFCRRHGAINTSDPNGRMRVVAERGALVRYRFGLRTADFLVCARCGVYVGCVLDDAFGSVNTRVLEDGARLTQPTGPCDWSQEDTDGRIARRRARWTPATVEERP
ncbi:MAG: GFA family protein [Polyangia bacterium]